MLILKTAQQIQKKTKGGMTKNEMDKSYEEVKPNEDRKTATTGKEKILKFNGEKFYQWIFHPEFDAKTKKRFFRFRNDEERERYEWFCGGWIQFYDEIVRDKSIEHKLFFFWGRQDKKGVAIYINDKRAIENKNKTMMLSYTPATATGDPPTPPPPPPPSSL